MGTPAQNFEGRLVKEPGVGTLEIWDLEPSESTLHALLTDLFTNSWREITFGPLIQGAAFELRPSGPAENISLLDGYLTVNLGRSHFHLCIGETRGDPARPTEPGLAHHRRTRQAELFRRINREGTPDSWGLRMLNGAGEQQITILFPNPFLTDDLTFEAQPNWSRLELWDHVRKKYLSLPPDDRDRSGIRMIHP